MSDATDQSSIDRQRADFAASHSPSNLDADLARPHLYSTQPHSPSSSTLHSTASVASSSAISPTFSAAFTPPSSVPMSAQNSQTSISAVQPFASSSLANLQRDTPMISPPDTGNAATSTEDQHASNVPSKRKFQEASAEYMSGSPKRPRIADPMEGVETAGAEGFGPYYKLAQREHVPSRPHASQNLISLYGLDDIASSVARFDPTSGQKINRLRQSYEGKIKDLPGRNKKVSKEGELMDILRYPDEEWQIQKVAGHDLTQGLPDDFDELLARATDLEPGRLPDAEHEHWKNIIALDESGPKDPQSRASSQKESTSQPLSTGTPNPTSDSTRSMRKGTKRRYDDSAFEGYPDTEHLDDASAPQSPDDAGDEGSIRRKKRRVRDSNSSPPIQKKATRKKSLQWH